MVTINDDKSIDARSRYVKEGRASSSMQRSTPLSWRA